MTNETIWELAEKEAEKRFKLVRATELAEGIIYHKVEYASLSETDKTFYNKNTALVIMMVYLIRAKQHGIDYKTAVNHIKNNLSI